MHGTPSKRSSARHSDAPRPNAGMSWGQYSRWQGYRPAILASATQVKISFNEASALMTKRATAAAFPQTICRRNHMV